MNPASRNVRSLRGFTLVEVLISIAIALVLIIGISQIFAMAQQTSGAGTILLKDVADQRNIQVTLATDIRDMVTGSDSPGMVIASYPIAAFRNKQDLDASRAGPKAPLAFNDTSGSGSLNPTNNPAAQAFETNSRVHRVDRMCFFARDLFHRQTADSPNYVSPTVSNEAFIWFGHLSLPNNSEISNWNPNDPAAINPTSQSQAFFSPGAPGNSAQQRTNDNNFFAADWILGREVILLLSPPVQPYPESVFLPNNAQNQPLSLGVNTPAAGSTAGSADPQAPIVPLPSSRYDLSYTPISACKAAFAPPTLAGQPDYSKVWWQDLIGLQVQGQFGGYPYIDHRYFANPFPTKPAGNLPARWMSAAAAQTAPIFVRGCSQFIVEFAGNYLTQDMDPTHSTYGQILSAQPDTSPAHPNKIDFIPVWDSQTATWKRQIRWYGFPRDVDGDGLIRTNVTPNTQVPGTQTPTSFDVVPLNWVISSAGFSPDPYLYDGKTPLNTSEFEKGVPNANQTTMQSATLPFNSGDNNLIPQNGTPYICAWDPNAPASVKPKMIRIIIAIDDPSGRLSSEQTYEYIYTLP